MIAALPMYDLPEARAATDAWWAILCQHFRRAGLDDMPTVLTRTALVTDSWTAPELMFTQTCGYPLTHDWADYLQLVATPCHTAEGCDGPTYSSAILVAEDAPARTVEDLRGRHVAYNGAHSQSGYNALRAMIAPLAQDGQFFGQATESGGHRQSMQLVRDGSADVCAVDFLTFAMHQRYAPEHIDGLRVLDRTEAAPALPYVTAIGRDAETVARLRDGLRAAIADPSATSAREALFLEAVEVLPRAAYDAIDAMEDRAIALGYPALG